MKTVVTLFMMTCFYLLMGCGNGTSTRNEGEIDSTEINKAAENANTAGNTENANQNPDDTSNTVKLSPADSIKNTGAGVTTTAASLRAPMDTVLKKISTTKKTGDFDIDYAISMIEHHQGAIDMSEYEFKNGKDDKVKDLAGRIMKSQNEDITRLKSFLKSYLPSRLKQGEGIIAKTSTEAMNNLNTKSLSGDIDKDYTMLIVEHHQFGLKMADQLQTHGASEDLKKMAKEQKAEMTKDIRDLKAVVQMK